MRLPALLLPLVLACVQPSALAGQLRADSAPSPALGRPLPFVAYLPDGYDAGAPLPVVYLLHGAGGGEQDWSRKGGAAETMDALIRRGTIRPAVVVMPSAGSDSWWTDGPRDKAETAFMRDLLPYVESHYKVRTGRADRAVAGLSMGGYGALHFALTYPERFCAAGLLSPAIYDPLPPDNASAWRTPQLMRDGRFDAARWQVLSFPLTLPAYAAQRLRVPMWIVTGDHDNLGIALLSARLYDRLLAIQPGLAELRVVDGGHEWMVWRDELAGALQYMDRRCSGAAP